MVILDLSDSKNKKSYNKSFPNLDHAEFEFFLNTSSVNRVVKLFLSGDCIEIVHQYAVVEPHQSDWVSYTLFEKLISRIGGSLLAVLSVYIVSALIREEQYGWPLVIALIFSAVFIIGTIRFEVRLRKKDSMK